ncbi:MAG TPA: hypothetical protein VJO13_05925 [Ktedonobacterales bacterium]|nr:hypothetical protein [Ktedonobacterales bacterium]
MARRLLRLVISSRGASSIAIVQPDRPCEQMLLGTTVDEFYGATTGEA